MRPHMLLHDVRFGIRMMRKHPGLSLIVIVTLGVGIGYTSTVFNITASFVHRALPFPDPARILALDRQDAARTFQYGEFTVPTHDFVAWREQQSAFEQLAAYYNEKTNLATGDGWPERARSGVFTHGVFEALGARPILGRTFAREDELPGAGNVIVLAYDLWMRRFGGAPDVLGRTVVVDAVPRTVIGVMPRGFRFPFAEQYWLPAVLDLRAVERGRGPRYAVLGRLRDGVSAGSARAQMATIAARLAQEYPESNEGIGVKVTTLRGRLIPALHYSLFYTMLAATLGVLLIGCANIANLLLARAVVREREVAVRYALGASRGRLVTQLVTEVMVLGFIGGAVGMLLGNLGFHWFVAKVSVVLTTAGDGDDLPFWIHFERDHRMLLFVVGATIFSSVLAAVVPAFRGSVSNPAEAMKAEGRGSSGLRVGKLTGGLVTAEVAISCVLMVVAGLMIKSVRQLATIDLPFATEHVLSARIMLPGQQYPSPASRLEFNQQLLAELETIPGTSSATLSNYLPGPGYGTAEVMVEGRTYAGDHPLPRAHVGWVTPGYFDTFGGRPLRGRVFTAVDRTDALPVAVVNESFAAVHLEGDAIGHRIRVAGDETPWLTVVGVVPDMSMDMFGSNGDPAGFYTPMAQSQIGFGVALAVRSQGPPLAIERAVRRAIAAVDPNLPPYRVMPMASVMLRMTWFYPVFGRLFMTFGFTALFLGAIGLYGVMAFTVTQRTREMGIRMALGAGGGSLLGSMLRKSIIQSLVGLGLGFLLALFAGRLLEQVLYEVNGRDPMVFGIVTTTVALTCLVAGFAPAYRITRINPTTALTAE